MTPPPTTTTRAREGRDGADVDVDMDRQHTRVTECATTSLMARPERVLFVENEDSFSWNVVDRLPVARARVRVVAGRDARLVARSLDEAELVVIGPGPQDPHRAPHLARLVHDAAARALPLLGVCLGHQALGVAFGAVLARATPTHGKRDAVRFAGARLFPGFDGDVEVMRYHSLALAAVPAPLRVVAATADGLCMAIEHATLPMAGVQFHPDSFGTPRGEEMLRAFFEAAL